MRLTAATEPRRGTDGLKAPSDADLHWTQPDPFARAYQLQLGADLLATLRWRHPWGTLAEARTQHGHWTFRRDGFWQTRFLVQQAHTGADTAIVRAGFAGAGIMEAADGRRFHWGSADFWQSTWVWQSAAREPLLFLRRREGLRTAEAFVTITPQGAGHAYLALLACLGWYLLLPSPDFAPDSHAP